MIVGCVNRKKNPAGLVLPGRGGTRKSCPHKGLWLRASD